MLRDCRSPFNARDAFSRDVPLLAAFNGYCFPSTHEICNDAIIDPQPGKVNSIWVKGQLSNDSELIPRTGIAFYDIMVWGDIMRKWLIAAMCAALIVVLVVLIVPLMPKPFPKDFDGAVFSPLDALGRAGVAMAVLSRDTLDSDRKSISDLTPTGYRTRLVDSVPGGYLWNRCHLIAAQLAFGTERLENLVTGTRQFNTAMLGIESRVADYLKTKGKRVLYRVEPDFHGDELICRGVSMRVWSIEDDTLRLDVYIDNIQDGVAIDYLGSGIEGDWILNVNSMRFHRPNCPGAAGSNPKNRQDFHGTRGELIERGYKPCSTCKS